jgi:hypothetical protein
VHERGVRLVGRPWLVLRGPRHEAVLWNGPVLELDRARPLRLGPDILAVPPDLEAMVARLRAEDRGRAVGDALLDQRLVAGIGNVWKAEALWAARVSPWRPLREISDDELRAVLGAARSSCARVWTVGGPRGACTGTPVGRARAAESRSAREGRAMPTAPPIGARGASGSAEERRCAARKPEAWPLARLISSMRSGVSASGPSRS